jgi:hypothetical protein
MPSLAPPAASSPPWWAQVLPVAVVLLAFGGTLAGGFLADDFVYIVRFRELPWAEWPGLFTQEWSGGVWGSKMRELRPMAALSFMIDAKLWGGNPTGYRVTNLLLHALATWLVLRVTWRASRGHAGAALTAGLIFALHPTHAEPVLWITGRSDLLATVAALGFWLLAERYTAEGRTARLAGVLLVLTTGIFSKELCLVAPLLLLLHWIAVEPRAGATAWRRRGAVLAGTAVIFAVYWWCRQIALGPQGTGHNLWTDLPSWERQMNYLGWLVPILPFSPGWQWTSTPSLPVMHAVFLAVSAASVVAAVWLAWRNLRTGASILFFGALWYLVTVPPLLAVVYFSPRHLYFPTVGLAIAIGLALAAAARARLSFALAAGVVVVGTAVALPPAMQPWIDAAQVSRKALLALEQAGAGAAPETVLFTAVPDVSGPVLLWAWSGPHALGAPFLSRPFDPSRILMRAGNHYRSENPPILPGRIAQLEQAPEAIALFVSAEGTVSCRRLSARELAGPLSLLSANATNGLSAEAWTAWVKSLAEP